MKHLISLVFLLNCLSSFAQEPAYTPMRLNYQFRGIKTDSLFLVPSYTDTTQANNYTAKNIPGSLIRTGSDFWMRNGIATAWLQNVNIGPGASPAVQFVDSVWRVVGKDSIFWRKGGVTNKIKDSTGAAYAGDSPDRIDGTATARVDADMQGYTFKVFGDNTNTASIQTFSDIVLNASDSLRFEKGNIKHYTGGNKYEFKDFNNTFLRIDTLGNFEAGDMTTNQLVMGLSKNDSAFQLRSKAPSTWREGNSGLTSQVKTGYAATDIDLSAGNYVIKLPGVYSVLTAHATNTLEIPNPADWGGQSITIINRDGIAINYAGGNDPFLYDGTQINTQWALSILTMYSDGARWFAIYNK